MLRKGSSRRGQGCSNAIQGLSTRSQPRVQARPRDVHIDAVSRPLEHNRAHEQTEISLISEKIPTAFLSKSLLSFIKLCYTGRKPKLNYSRSVVKNRNYPHWAEWLLLVNYKFCVCVCVYSSVELRSIKILFDIFIIKWGD